ncbi:MAG: hypothetical protein GY754_40985 [bacterium]|nr:hypothetical protein [bacterium]
MMNKLFSGVFYMMLMSVLAFSGCEQGLTVGSDSKSGSGENQETGFSFSDMYSQMKIMKKEIDRLKQLNEEQEKTIEKYNRIFAGVSRDENNNIIFSGVNVQIDNGLGYTNGVDDEHNTDGTVNGLGNLVLGYNEERNYNGAENNRTGSHNLIVGSWNNYSSYGGIVVGFRNTISGKYSSVSGGGGSAAVGANSSVSGGWNNTAGGEASSVSGGNVNYASGVHSSVSGGYSNTASGAGSGVSGGLTNVASGANSSVNGGRDVTTGNWCSSASGGHHRAITTNYNIY